MTSPSPKSARRKPTSSPSASDRGSKMDSLRKSKRGIPWNNDVIVVDSEGEQEIGADG